MFLIDSIPSSEILIPIISEMRDSSPKEIEDFILSRYDEDWFSTQTSSLKGNDNRLNHRIRSIRSKMGIHS